MKDLIILAILAFAGWSYYQDHMTDEPIELAQVIQSNLPINNLDPTYTSSIKKNEPEFSCDGRKYCSEMNSKQEALFFLRHCPGTLLDGDNDGIPCEGDNRF